MLLLLGLIFQHTNLGYRLRSKTLVMGAACTLSYGRLRLRVKIGRPSSPSIRRCAAALHLSFCKPNAAVQDRALIVSGDAKPSRSSYPSFEQRRTAWWTGAPAALWLDCRNNRIRRSDLKTPISSRLHQRPHTLSRWLSSPHLAILAVHDAFWAYDNQQR